MGRKEGLFLLFLAVCHTIADPNLPRGVGPDFAKYYNNREIFNCISNPSIQVALSRINDDFCDCPDGSDEPGTAACSGISPLSPHPLGSIPRPDGIVNINSTPALPGFYCYNEGHQPAYVPFENVNDGVCDYDQCCDGSEEWEGISDVKCPNRCAEFGKERQEREDKRQLARNAAFSRRRQLAVEAQRLRREVQDRVVSLNTEIEGGKKMVVDMEEELAEIKKEEQAKMVKSPKEAGSTSVLVSLVKDRIEELKRALIDVRDDRNSLKNRLAQVEGMLNRLKKEHDPSLLDKGVKDVVQSWEKYSTRDKGVEREGVEKDIDEILSSDEENGINWEEWEDIEIGDAAHLYDLTAYLPPTVRTWFETRLTDLRQYLIDHSIIAPNAFSSLFSSSSSSSSKSTESKRLSGAKNRLEAAKSELDSQRKEIDNHIADLARDYSGSDKKDDIFRALKGTCVQLDAGEYTYELCFMERASQKTKQAKAGSGGTNMGNFAKMERIEVQEEGLDLERHDWLIGGAGGDGDGVEPSKLGSASGKRLRLVQRYESGQSCWNGLRRSTTVVLACAEKDELWRVVEMEKCVYRMEVGTAAACDEDDGTVSNGSNVGSGGSGGAGSKEKGKKNGKDDGKEKDEL